jgi:hypothetical protein
MLFPHLTCGEREIIKMGMRDDAVAMPDTYGLPVYRIDRTVKQRVGDEIQILCGSEMFGQTQWNCILVIRADVAVTQSMETIDIAMTVRARPSSGH